MEVLLNFTRNHWVFIVLNLELRWPRHPIHPHPIQDIQILFGRWNTLFKIYFWSSWVVIQWTWPLTVDGATVSAWVLLGIFWLALLLVIRTLLPHVARIEVFAHLGGDPCWDVLIARGLIANCAFLEKVAAIAQVKKACSWSMAVIIQWPTGDK